jgi:hypothetical protein
MSKPLKNIRQEKFVRALVEKPISQTQAYQEAYGLEDKSVAKVNASQLLTKPHVKERIAELLDRDGLSVDYLNGRLKRHCDSDSENISLEATKFGYRLHGCLEDDKANIGNQGIEINIMNIGVTPTTNSVSESK